MQKLLRLMRGILSSETMEISDAGRLGTCVVCTHLVIVIVLSEAGRRIAWCSRVVSREDGHTFWGVECDKSFMSFCRA